MANGATLPAGSYNLNASTTGTVQGARVRADVQSARRVVQHTGGIMINANVTPFLAASKKMGNGKTVGDAIAQHNEYDSTPGFVTLDDGTGGLGAGSGYDSSDNTLVTSSGQGSRVAVYDVLKVLSTGEIIYVTGRNSDTLTVTRGLTASYNGAAAAAIPASAELQILASNFPENSTVPNAKSTEPLIVYTYLQTSRTSVSGSRRLINSQNYGMTTADYSEWDRIHNAALEDHRKKKERAILFNQGYIAPAQATSTLGTMTDGVPNRIVTNRFNVAGALDEITFENYAIALFRYNQGKSGNIINFIGDNVTRTIDQFARDLMRYDPETTVLGCDVRAWRCAAGKLQFTQHGMFSPQTSSNSYAQGSPVGWMLSVNFDNVNFLNFRGEGGKLTYDPNCKTPGQDGEVGCWTEDWGIEMWNERTHGWMYGVSGA